MRKMTKKQFEHYINYVWFILMFILLLVSRIDGHASGGETIIGLLLWYDVGMRMFERLNR